MSYRVINTLAREWSAIRGEPPYRLSVLRNEAVELMDDLDASDPERALMQRRIEAIDCEMASPSAGDRAP